MAPLGWEEAAELARDGSEERLSRLKRSESVLARYRERRGEIGEVWASTSDYVLARYFGAAASAALGDGRDGGRRRVGSDEEARLAAEGRVVWAPNDFPYDLEPGIAHFVVWSARGELSREEVLLLARGEAGPGADLAVFVNPPGLRSVHRVWHAHVLVRGPAEAAPPPSE